MPYFRLPSLDKSVPMVDPVTGRPSTQFQRFWQNIAIQAGDTAGTAAGAVLKSDFASWSSPSGTLTRSSFATYTAPVASATYSQAQMQAVMDALQAVSRATGALVVDLRN